MSDPNDKQKCGSPEHLAHLDRKAGEHLASLPRADGSAAEVKRYDIYMHSDDVQFLRECVDGDYVRFSAYDAVVAERDRLLIRDQDAARHELRIYEQNRSIANLRSRVAELERALQPLASFPIEQHQHRSTSGAPLYGFNGWLLLPGHVYSARAALSGSQPCP